MTVLSPAAAPEAHQLLAELSYDLRPVERGYANRTLYVNVGDLTIQSKPVTDEMKRVFTGGRGFGLWLLWNGTRPETRWNDPENELVITGGVIGGIASYPGSGKCTAVTISPQTGVPIDSNSGGYFGPYLKFAGWDAIEIQGKAEQDVIIIVDGDLGVVRVEAAPLEPVDTHLVARLLTDMYGDTPKEKRGISVVSAGQAADHVAMCGLNVSYYDPRRDEIRIKQAARGGAGRVLRDKRIKAIVVRYSELTADSNGVADMALLQKAGQRIKREISQFDESQNDMRGTGTPYLVEIMNRFDLLPTQNYRFGAHVEAHKIAGDIWKPQFDRRGPDGCWYGCTMACAHAVDKFELETGPYKGQKVCVDGPEYETAAGVGSNLYVYDPHGILEINFYCDTYGICTITWGTIAAFVFECYQRGILNKERTGGLDLTWGNWRDDLEMMHQCARGEGFGKIAGQGVKKMKELFIANGWGDPKLIDDIGMENKGLEYSQYLSKESLAQQGGYALTNKGPQHDEAWLIFMDMVNKQLPSFEDKAEALYYFPLWRTWFGLNGWCKLPWNDVAPSDNHTRHEAHKIPEHVENYLAIHGAVTGNQITVDDMLNQSARVYNFQRIFNIRQGKGLRVHDKAPYRSMGPVTKEEYLSRLERYEKELRDEVGVDPTTMTLEEKIAATRAYREARFEKLIDTVYKRRGWTPNGVPTLDRIKELGIDLPEVVEVVKAHL